MDPFTALALACAVVQFVDFGFKLLKSTTDIHHSTTGATAQDDTIESVTQKLKDLTLDLNHDISSPQSPLEKRVQELAEECRKLSEELLRVLEKAKAKSDSRFESARVALRNMRHSQEKNDLLARLDRCQNQLTMQLVAQMR